MAKSTTKLSKAEREQRIQQQKRNQQMLLGVVAVVFLVGVIVAIFMATRPPEATLPEGVNTHYADIQAKNFQGTTDEGFPFIGDPKAPSTMEEFGSFSCPHCMEYHDGMFTSLLDEIQAGRVKFVFIPVINIGDWDSQNEAESAFCAAQQGKFWEMNDVLYSWWSLYGAGSDDPKRINVAAQQLGLDMNKFNSCLSSGTGKQLVEKAAELESKRDVNVTPTIFFNGQQISPNPKDNTSPTVGQMRGLIEAAAAGKS